MLLLPSLFLAQAPVATPAPAPAELERRLAAMGTWLEVRIGAGDRAAALAASEAAVRAIEAVEARLSTWREDSELARLNRTPVGEVCTLSPELARDLARADRFWRETGGAFDPGLGALVSAWGLRTGGRMPASEELALARSAGWSAFRLDGRSAVRLDAAAAVEEGGFGKGIALDAALDALRVLGVGQAVLDLGGQVATLGGAHTLALADPRARERAVLELELAPGSLSTSGNSEHGIVVDGVRRGHLLDPRTGEPAEDFGSLSVWAADATAADCLSTGLYVLGPDEALRWCAAHAGTDVVVLQPRGERLVARLSERWRGRARALVPELELRFVADEAARSLPPPTPDSPR